jgi:ribosomal protein L7/L12
MDGWDRVDQLIRERKTILAIKEIRVLTGCGLRDAVDRFEQRCAELRETDPPRR